MSRMTKRCGNGPHHLSAVTLLFMVYCRRKRIKTGLLLNICLRQEGAIIRGYYDVISRPLWVRHGVSSAPRDACLYYLSIKSIVSFFQSARVGCATDDDEFVPFACSPEFAVKTLEELCHCLVALYELRFVTLLLFAVDKHLATR